MTAYSRASLITLAAAAFATSALAQQPIQPFGIQMGAAKQTLKIEKDLTDGMVKLASVPKPHPDMERYIVEVTPKAGVCFVKGMGKTLPTSAYGSGVESTFNDLKAQLESVYGKAKVIDHLASGSIWKEPNEYTMAMLKKERWLSAMWGSEKGTPLAPGVQFILLSMTALSRESFYANVEYYGTNSELCDAEVRNLKANAFK